MFAFKCQLKDMVVRKHEKIPGVVDPDGYSLSYLIALSAHALRGLSVVGGLGHEGDSGRGGVLVCVSRVLESMPVMGFGSSARVPSIKHVCNILYSMYYIV